MQKRSNEQWLSDLRSPGPLQETALADLRALILAGLPYALESWLSANDPRFGALAEEVAQDTLLRVLDHLDEFEGRSQFTTWAQKIAVRVALTELRRKRWENVSLDELLSGQENLFSEELFASTEPGPEAAIEGADMINRLQRIIADELTEKQRQAMVALVVKGMPVEVVAQRMNTNSSALYKLMHDARRRIIQRLEREGLTPQDLLETFARR